jgi:DNA invertase Pin-like site-specific DNA recombinase
MNRAVIYARVSSQEQRARNTIDSQLRELPALAARLGMTVLGTFADNGVSGAALLERRQGLLGMLERLKAGDVSHVLVYDLDRFTRHVRLDIRGRIFGAIQASSVVIVEHTTGAQYDLNTFEGRLTVQIRAELAADWLQKHKQRIKDAKALAVSRNRKPAGPTPYGLDYDRATGTFSIHESEAAAIHEIYESVIAGASCARIAEALNLRKVPGARSKHRRRAPYWRSDRVWWIATSPIYRGEWTVDKAKGSTLRVPAIVSPETWAQAQQAMRSPLRGTPRGKSPIVCLASRLARCALCGSVVQVHMRSGGKSGRRYQYYVCRNVSHPRTRAEKCALKARRYEEVDARLWAAVVRLLTEGWHELERRLLAQAMAVHGRQDQIRVDLDQAEAEMLRVAGVERALVERFRRGMLSEESLDEALEQLAQQRRAAEEARAQARERLGHAAAGVEALTAAVAAIRDRLPNAAPAVRQQLVRALIEPGKLRLGQWSIEATVGLSWSALARGMALQAGSNSQHQHAVGDGDYVATVELVA